MEILNEKVGIAFGIILVLLGIFIYHTCMIMGSKRVARFKDINLLVWWYENQIRFIMSLMVVTVIFILSAKYDTLTAEHCLELGSVGNLFLDRFLKAMNV